MNCGTDPNMEGSGSADSISQMEEPAGPATVMREQRELELSRSEPLVDPGTQAQAETGEQKLLDEDGSEPMVDASTKARAFLARKKTEMSENVRAKFADKIATYDAIRSFIGRANMAPDMFGSRATLAYELGDFFPNSDGRMALCELRCDYGAMANTSYSFDPSNWECKCCGEAHRILERRTGQPSRSATRRIFLIGDQACPPTLPGDDNMSCIPVLRQEDASIKDLVRLFMHTVRGFTLQPGSLVVVTSATQMAGAGISHYLDHLSQARSMLGNFTRGEVELVPGPPFLYEGTTSKQLLRTIAEMTGWLNCGSGSVCTLTGTFHETIQELKNTTVGPQTVMDTCFYTLPSFTTSGAPEKMWCSGVKCLIPAQVAELNQAGEQRIVNKMVDELTVKTGIGLATVTVNRRPDPKPSAEGARGCVSGILVVGASNADRLAAELQQTGIKVVRIKTTNWTPSKEGVADLAAHVRRAVDVNHPDAVVFQMMDNIVYLARDPLGVTTQPKRGEDGIYHVKGELVLAHRDVQFSIYKTIKPVLAAAGAKPIIIVTPFPRYMSAACCTDPEHMTNYGDQDFGDNLRDKLEEMRSNMRSYLFSDNIRRAGVINPTPLLDQTHPAGQWDDPVHPARPFFTKLADMVMKSAERILGKRRLSEGNAEEIEQGDRSRHNSGSSYGGGSSHRGGRGGRSMGLEWAGTARGPREEQHNAGYSPAGGSNRITGTTWRGRRGRGRGHY